MAADLSHWFTAALRAAFTAALVGCMPTAGLRYPTLPAVEQGALHIIFMDIGQADATLIRYGGKTLLIDAGASRLEPERTAQRAPRRLKALVGSMHVDYFLATHYHADHIGTTRVGKGKRETSGLYALIEREGLTIGTLLDRGNWRLDQASNEQLDYERATVKWLASGQVGAHRELHAGDFIDLGAKLEVEVITAAGNGQLERLRAMFPTWIANYPPTENDYSIGVKISLGDFEMFTAGDLSGVNVLRDFGNKHESYNDMESRIAGTIGPIEVYHAHHHGSRNSSNPCFIEVLMPQVSVITSGKNRYGHPDPGVYARLEQAGTVRVVSGCDPRTKAVRDDELVGDDVEVLVSPEGRAFWVNGQPFTARSEAEERAQPKYRASCDDTLGGEHKVEGQRKAEPEVGD